MLLMHFILSNYERGDPRPILNGITHWLQCFVLAIGSWVALLITLGIIALIFGR